MTTGPVQIWAVPDMATVFPDSSVNAENEVYTAAGRTIRLQSAINETVSFQLAMRAEGGPATLLGIQADPLQQGPRTITPGAFRFYRELRREVVDYPTWFLRLTPELAQPREYPDALVPFGAPTGALPMPLEPGRCEAVWADLRVPPGTEPGNYRGALYVRLAAGQTRRLELMLTVHPFSLPGTHHLGLLAGLDSLAVVREHVQLAGKPYSPQRLSVEDPLYPQATAVLDETIRLLHEHRCSPILTDLQPVRRVTAGGGLELDWTDYDRLISAVMDGSAFDDRVPVWAWPMPISEREPAPSLYGGWASPRYERMLVDHLRQCVAHFQERGWLDRHYVYFTMPGDNRGEAYRQFSWLGEVIRTADTRLASVCALTPQSMQPYGWVNDPFKDVSSLVGIWAPPASLCDPEVLAAQRRAGKRIWLNPDRPPFAGSLAVIAPSVHPRSLAWMAYRFGCEALMLPAINDWSGGRAADGQNDARSLIWPGRAYGLSGPIPSIRLKRLMRGAQDSEYLWLLEHNGRPGVAELIAADLVPFGGTTCYADHFLDSRPNGWVPEPEAWTMARSLMAGELSEAMAAAERPTTAPAADEQQRFERQLAWRRHVEAVRRLHTHVEGLRVRIDPQRSATPLRVTATVNLFNATRQAYSGQITYAALPTGWNAGPPAEPIDALEPGAAARREVVAWAAAIPTNVDGIAPLKVTRTSGDEPAAEFDARLCLLTAARPTVPIRVDGLLDDWPRGSTNSAGSFVLVGAQEVPKRGRPSPTLASQQTVAMALSDAEYLYLGFVCRDDRPKDMVFSRSNAVRYDELWPSGEDLVEVVCDPTGQAVSPGELYHIVVKTNGAVVTEMGAPCLKLLGGHGRWPAEVLAAVDTDSLPGQWSVEIRVPLSAFGKAGLVWGINFARYQARVGEYSTWTGARRYTYSPASLGNLILAH